MAGAAFYWWAAALLALGAVALIWTHLGLGLAVLVLGAVVMLGCRVMAVG
ncbi:hypothetical protein [Roseomonas xinghualingensis]|nr:hypothetical protein [Roseomonas sp. SXEYE001]MCV4210212.1 hypothetical protein [Roseomonas sp. SXEYE001]